MRSKVELKDFIQQVKDQLRDAAEKGKEDPFFGLSEVVLEASFTIENSGEGGAKFFVVEGKMAAKEAHTHKVCMKFVPITKFESQDGAENRFFNVAHRVTVWVIFDEIRVAGAWR